MIFHDIVFNLAEFQTAHMVTVTEPRTPSMTPVNEERLRIYFRHGGFVTCPAGVTAQDFYDALPD
jgi:hypothetical protein